jgi:uncharacterized protein (DUF302 family)
MTMDWFEITIPLSIDEADGAAREALAGEGFGVLTEIDVAATLKAKLGVDRPPLRILGACNPGFASRALEVDPAVALVLPCNVVLEPVDAGTRVRIVDPRALIDDARFTPLAHEAAQKLQAVLADIAKVAA